MTAHRQLQGCAPRLRIFSGEESEPVDVLTVRAAYESLLLDEHKADRAENTISAYYTTINHWENHTSDPPVSQITDQTVREFSQSLLAVPMSAANVMKQWRNLRAIFRRCAPRQFGNPRGLPFGRHLIEFVPYLEPLSHQPTPKRIMPLELLSATYRACHVATYPRKCPVPPAMLWRTVFVLDYNFGPRTMDLFGLTWDCVHWDIECPDENVRASNEHGWLRYLPTKTKRKKPSPLTLPLNAVTRAHLEAIRGDRRQIFPVTSCVNDIQTQRKAIQRAAGIARPYTFQEIRKTCSTHWNDLWPGLGEYVTGHAKRGVNAIHYDESIGRLCRFVHQLPQPEAFLDPPGGIRQLSLF